MIAPPFNCKFSELMLDARMLPVALCIQISPPIDSMFSTYTSALAEIVSGFSLVTRFDPDEVGEKIDTVPSVPGALKWTGVLNDQAPSPKESSRETSPWVFVRPI